MGHANLPFYDKPSSVPFARIRDGPETSDTPRAHRPRKRVETFHTIHERWSTSPSLSRSRRSEPCAVTFRRHRTDKDRPEWKTHKAKEANQADKADRPAGIATRNTAQTGPHRSDPSPSGRRPHRPEAVPQRRTNDVSKTMSDVVHAHGTVGTGRPETASHLQTPTSTREEVPRTYKTKQTGRAVFLAVQRTTGPQQHDHSASSRRPQGGHS